MAAYARLGTTPKSCIRLGQRFIERMPPEHVVLEHAGVAEVQHSATKEQLLVGDLFAVHAHLQRLGRNILPGQALVLNHLVERGVQRLALDGSLALGLLSQLNQMRK